MSNATNMRSFEETLAAGEERTIHAWARMLTVLSSTATRLTVSLGGEPYTLLLAGVGYELPQGEHLTSLKIRNDGAASADIVVVLSEGRVYDNRIVIGDTIDVNPAANTFELDDRAATDALGSVTPSGTVREVIVHNRGANSVWLGDVDLDADTENGIELLPAKSIVLATSAKIYYQCKTGETAAVNFFTLDRI